MATTDAATLPIDAWSDERLERTRTDATRVLQLPLSVLAMREKFRENASQIASIVENSNPEDPRLLADELDAHKVCLSFVLIAFVWLTRRN